MYTSYYSLNMMPFRISSDPSFIWLGEKHKEALATLRYGILESKGFLLLTGDVGTGKTTLINTLLSSLGDEVICVAIPDPRLEILDFFNFVAQALGIEKEFTSKGTFLAHLKQVLQEAHDQGKQVLLLIDESQLLTQELLEEIRLLSNINIDNSQVLNIFFVGQNEFNEQITRPENRAVANRITLNYQLAPLSPEETGEYIHHRLRVAGAAARIFDDSAIRAVFDHSGGLPRRINIICDHSLLSGYVVEKKTLTDQEVQKAAADLTIPTSTTTSQAKSSASCTPPHRSSTFRSGLAGMLARVAPIMILAALLFFALLPEQIPSFFLGTKHSGRTVDPVEQNAPEVEQLSGSLNRQTPEIIPPQPDTSDTPEAPVSGATSTSVQEAPIPQTVLSLPTEPSPLDKQTIIAPIDETKVAEDALALTDTTPTVKLKNERRKVKLLTVN